MALPRYGTTPRTSGSGKCWNRRRRPRCAEVVRCMRERFSKTGTEKNMSKRLNILTWHTHGSYLYYLTQGPHNFYVLSKPERPPGYGGRCGHMPWGANVIDMPVAEVK